MQWLRLDLGKQCDTRTENSRSLTFQLHEQKIEHPAGGCITLEIE